MGYDKQIDKWVAEGQDALNRKLAGRSINQGQRLKRVEAAIGITPPIDEPDEPEPPVVDPPAPPPVDPPVEPDPPAEPADGILRGVNTSYADQWLGEPMCANEMKQGRWWTTTDWSQSIGRKADGGPAGTPARLALYHGMGGHYHKGERVLRWDGGAQVKVEGDASGSGTNRIAFNITNTTDSGIQLVVLSGAFSNPRLTRADQENEPNAPHKGMVDRLVADGVRVLRFMNWMQANRKPAAQWSQRPTMNSWSWGDDDKGAPVEAMVALCNAANCDPWFCFHDTWPADYCRNFMQYVKENLKPGLKPYIEPSNEVWNGGFPQHGRAGGWSGYLNKYPQMCVALFDIALDVFGADGCHRVVGSQHDNGNPTDATNWLDGVLLTSAVKQRATHLAIAPYFANTLTTSPSTFSSADAIINWMAGAVDRSIGLCMPHKRSADAAGLELCAYESGPHFFPTGDAGADGRLVAIRNDARFGAICGLHLNRLHNEVGMKLVCDYSYIRRQWAGLLSQLDDAGKPRHTQWKAN